MAKSKKYKHTYEFGSFVKQNSTGIGNAGQFLAGSLDTFKNPNKANVGLTTGQGILSGAAAGASLGVPGMIGGALIGGAMGLVGANKQKKQIDNQRDATYGNLRGEQANTMSTTNINPYGTQIYQDGGVVKKAYNPSLGNKDKQFLNWYSKNTIEGQNKVPYNSFQKMNNYDYYSFYKNGDYKNKNFNPELHFPDTYKLPNHPTFSDESIYDGNKKAGTWLGDNFIPKKNKYQDGGRVAKNIKKSQPNPNFPNWDGIVEKNDGSIGMWGNPIDTLKVNPILPNVLPMGSIDHRGVRTGQKYQGTLQTNKAIEAKERMLKSQSSRNYYANGSDVEQNIINIEKGELQIDTKSGKILREYTGINPESAGLYQPHAKKGKDSDNNFVTAEPETFIVTKSKASKYKKAIDNNDKLAQQSILQNIRNYKSTVEGGKLKFAIGGDTPKNPYLPTNYLATSGIQPISTYGLTGLTKGITQQPVNTTTIPGMKVTDMLAKPSGTPYVPNPSMLTKGLDAVSQYGPAAFNLARGMFGNVEQERYGTKAINPYLNQIKSNMPQDIDMQPIYNDIYSQGRVATQDLRNNANNSGVYRANRQNIGANTQRQISSARLQGQMANNQIRGQRANIYAGLGAQDMQEQQRLQQYNLGINQINAQNRGAKQNLLGTGMSQLQEIYNNKNYNDKMYDMQMLQYKLLPQIYGNWKYYQDNVNLPKKK